jgi:hypothetical protein
MQVKNPSIMFGKKFHGTATSNKDENAAEP